MFNDFTLEVCYNDVKHEMLIKNQSNSELYLIYFKIKLLFVFGVSQFIFEK